MRTRAQAGQSRHPEGAGTWLWQAGGAEAVSTAPAAPAAEPPHLLMCMVSEGY